MSSHAPQTPMENQRPGLAIHHDAPPQKPSSQCRHAQRFHLPPLEPSTAPRARSSHPASPAPQPSEELTTTTDASRIRSPSTSPPPEPPAQQFMMAGPSGDDRYRMVEDELLRTARRFTTHLHRAEYARLKKLAAAQNAAAIRDMQRPVVPGLATATATATAATRRREAASRTARRGASSLQGLMETPRGRDARLRPRAAVVSASSTGGWRRGQGLASSFGGGGGGRGAEGEQQEEQQEEVDDDPFGVRERRVRREKSREQMRRTAGRETRETRETQTPTKPEDTIPWFF